MQPRGLTGDLWGGLASTLVALPAALAAILVVVAWRMFDWGSFRLLRQRSTALDFLIVAAVVAVAVFVGLVEASGTGIAPAILLFLREQVRGSVIHRKTYGDRIFSRQKRLPEQMAALRRRGGETVVCELEGNLFFGTTDHLLTELEADLRQRRFAILDLRRVRSADAVALSEVELFVLSRRRFDTLAEQHPRLGTQFFEALSRSLALRLRQADAEIGVLGEA